MKLLVFAHTPPPHHGQSYMVKLMLDGFGGDHRHKQATNGANRFGVECYHVNARLSRDLEDIGSFRPQKFLILFWHCLSAIWCRFRYGVSALYYVPAPGKRSALWRDWVVMTMCRPFFKDIVLHWHAAGLAKWLETAVQSRVRRLTYRTMGKASVSIVLSDYNRADALKLLPDDVRVVHNGIEDPCPNFEQSLLLRRQERLRARTQRLHTHPTEPVNPHAIRVAYLAHCTREKGVFDAANGVLIANQMLSERGCACRMVLSIGGSFLDENEEAAFKRLLQDKDPDHVIRLLGFVSGKEKSELLEDSDLFCFPTCFPNENEPVNLIEAIAYGLPVVTTRWRSVPEILPPRHPGLVATQSPHQVAKALLRLAEADCFMEARKHFLDHYLLDRHLSNLAQAISIVDSKAA